MESDGDMFCVMFCNSVVSHEYGPLVVTTDWYTSGKFNWNDNPIDGFSYSVKPCKMHHNDIHSDHAIYSLGVLTA